MKVRRLQDARSYVPTNHSNARLALSDYIRLPECKRLINRINTAQRTSNLKSIAVLSQYPGEGKTLFISAMALGFFTLLRKRVLIMDTVSQGKDDSFYGHSVIGRTLPKDEDQGKTGCIDLITTKSLSRAEGAEDLRALPGDFDPTLPAHFTLEDEHRPYRCADFEIHPFIETIKDRYDLILLDTCALTEVGKESFDPLILAQHADAAIVLSSPASMEREVMTSLTKELRRNHVSPLGIVVNSGLKYAA